MKPLFETVRDLRVAHDVLRRRRYGIIEVVKGRLRAIHLRPWPKLVSVSESAWLTGLRRLPSRRDRCLLYFNQPLRHPRFLALKFIVSDWGTTMATLRRALLVLDEIARIKRIDAIVCEAHNRRISDRLLRRWGWQRHVHHSRRRHYIKRFYGQYPGHGTNNESLVEPTK